jgi:NurA-like 5'-3' nuclease
MLWYLTHDVSSFARQARAFSNRLIGVSVDYAIALHARKCLPADRSPSAVTPA